MQTDDRRPTTDELPLDYWRQHQAEIITLVATLTPESALAALQFTTQQCCDGQFLAVHLVTNLRWVAARQAATQQAGAR